MSTRRGFTLLEVLITIAILTTGLVSIAAMFTYSARSNTATQRRTAAVMLVSEKMEEFKFISLRDSRWTAGGSLDPANPVSGYFDSDSGYTRVWQITGTLPRTVTVAVYADRTELARATTMNSRVF